MSRLAVITLVLGTLAMAGCAGPAEPGPSTLPPAETPRLPAACHAGICTANETSRDYKFALGHGYHQVTNTSEGYFATMRGDVITLHKEAWSGEEPVSDLYGYRIQNHSVFPLAVAEGLQTRAYQSGDLLLYGSTEPQQGRANGSMNIMVAVIGEQGRPVSHGLAGETIPAGFDYPWVLFLERADANTGGAVLWAMNIATNGLVRIQNQTTPAPQGQPYDLQWQAINAQQAFVSLVRSDGGSVESRIEEVNLTTGVRSTLYVRPHYAIVHVSASRGLLAWEESHVVAANRVYVSRLEKFEPQELVAEDEEAGYNPMAAGDWVLYQSQGHEFGGRLVGFHVPTGRLHMLVDGEPPLKYAGGLSTDGVRWVAEISRRGAIFEKEGSDTYWGALPTSS